MGLPSSTSATSGVSQTKIFTIRASRVDNLALCVSGSTSTIFAIFKAGYALIQGDSCKAIKRLQYAGRFLADSHRGFWGTIDPTCVEWQQEIADDEDSLAGNIVEKRFGGLVAAKMWRGLEYASSFCAKSDNVFVREGVSRICYLAAAIFSPLARLIDLVIGVVAAALSILATGLSLIFCKQIDCFNRAAQKLHEVAFKTLRPAAIITDPLIALIKVIAGNPGASRPCYNDNEEEEAESISL